MPLSSITDQARGSGKAVSAVSVGASATPLVGANPQRTALVIANNSASTTLYLGETSGVTTATGLPVPAGQSYREAWPAVSTDAWYGIVASGTADVRVLEVQ